jgi:hypothetical protein
MMALTLGQLAELPGFEEATIGTWEGGDLAHPFTERDVFETPVTVKAAIYQQLRQADFPPTLAMKIAGFDQAMIDEYEKEAAADALRQRTTLAAAMVQARAQVDSGAADNGLTRI